MLNTFSCIYHLHLPLQHCPQRHPFQIPTWYQNEAPGRRQSSPLMVPSDGTKSPTSITQSLSTVLAPHSPLQLSSGVLMTPLMAAWAAAFCFFRSSIVFLNSFSSESWSKEKTQRYVGKCRWFLTAPKKPHFSVSTGS